MLTQSAGLPGSQGSSDFSQVVLGIQGRLFRLHEWCRLFENPAINRDGTKIAYSLLDHGRMPIFVVDAGGGTPQQVCDNCGEVEEWSARGDQILYITQRDLSGIGLLTLGSSHNDAWLRHPGYGIYNPRLSSDGGWIAFNGRTDRLSPARAFIAKVHASGVAGEKEWIAIGGDADAPSWSPQANLLYFWSDRDGSPCLWAQRLDPATKQPIGSPLNISTSTAEGYRGRTCTSVLRPSPSRETRLYSTLESRPGTSG